MADSQRKQRLKRITALLLLPLGSYMLFRAFEHSQVYHPDCQLIASPTELARPFEDVSFPASDGPKLHGWFFPANADSPRARLAVLLCHGNGGNISYRLDHYRAILETGVSLFTFDYRGYGRSDGRPGEPGTYLDAQAAYHWLRQKGFAGANIIALGESLGGGVAAELALREPLGGVVLQSAFTSVPDLGAEFFPWLPVRLLGSIQYEVRGKLPRLKIPVMVMHSPADTLIRFPHGQQNFAAANEPKMFWELAGDHNDTLLAGEQNYVEGLRRFLAMIEAQRK